MDLTSSNVRVFDRFCRKHGSSNNLTRVCNFLHFLNPKFNSFHKNTTIDVNFCKILDNFETIFRLDFFDVFAHQQKNILILILTITPCNETKQKIIFFSLGLQIFGLTSVLIVNVIQHRIWADLGFSRRSSFSNKLSKILSNKNLKKNWPKKAFLGTFWNFLTKSCVFSRRPLPPQR